MSQRTGLQQPPSVVEFGKALWRNMFSVLSGGISVPLAAAGLWIQNDLARLGFMVTAFLCAWTATYRIWADERRRVIELDPPLPERISIVDLVKIAEKDHGWNFKSGWELLDLLHALRHAANDGILEIQGKKPQYGSSPPSDTWRRAQLLFEVIPRSEWSAFKLAIHAPFAQNPTEFDNFELLVTSAADQAPRYFDPHLFDRVKAVKWLERQAEAIRGFSERTHREEEAARRLRT